MSETLARYTLELLGPSETPQPVTYHGHVTVRTVGISPTVLRETEENLSDLLPADYSVRITEVKA